MIDMVAIGAALSSIKSATETAKFVLEAGSSVEKAELKLKAAELIGALADAKLQLTGVQDLLMEKDKRIAELQGALEMSGAVQRQGDAYYRLDGTGKPAGEPACLRCWEVDHRLRHLVRHRENVHLRACVACRTDYPARSVMPIAGA